MSDWTWQDIGLSVFVFVTVGTLGVLAYDMKLRAERVPMITDYCRAYPPYAWAILTALEIGVLGLAIHFMRPVGIEK